MSGKRGQPGRLRKLTSDERYWKRMRNIARNRAAKIEAKHKIVPGEAGRSGRARR